MSINSFKRLKKVFVSIVFITIFVPLYAQTTLI